MLQRERDHAQDGFALGCDECRIFAPTQRWSSFLHSMSSVGSIVSCFLGRPGSPILDWSVRSLHCCLFCQGWYWAAYRPTQRRIRQTCVTLWLREYLVLRRDDSLSTSALGIVPSWLSKSSILEGVASLADPLRSYLLGCASSYTSIDDTNAVPAGAARLRQRLSLFRNRIGSATWSHICCGHSDRERSTYQSVVRSNQSVAWSYCTRSQ